MSETEPRHLDLDIERPATGGRMLARHEGQVVLVTGAIPGERIRARIERRSRGVLWARAEEILTPSPHRRTPGSDSACGGAVYSHVDYVYQRQLKADIVADAFRRIGKLPLAEAVLVEPSPEQGYRWRARLHVDDGRPGFLVEGTHRWCDAGATRQLGADTLPAVSRLLAALGPAVAKIHTVTVVENGGASERAVHLEPREGTRLRVPDTADLLVPGISGVTMAAGMHSGHVLAGDALVSDTAGTLFGGDPPVPADTTWTRSPRSFFQANRFVTATLLRHVLAFTRVSSVLDLYAGVGLFAVGCAAAGARVVAVESDDASGTDLERNAAVYGHALATVRGSVEESSRALRGLTFDAVIVDPPRTGLSPDALRLLTERLIPRVVYVSCDPATLARDAAALVASGYRLASVRAFDMFPTTAHVETVAIFDWTSAGQPSR
jgi:23S rRNA (uracil1939-C5)-methyltransferase